MASNCLQGQNDSCADEEEEFGKNIPVVIMFSLFAAVGVFGNILILYIYGLKFKESTTRVFILSLAVFDLISCVSLPYKITLLRYGSLFSNPTLARLEIIRIYFLQLSVSILPLMSFDRYRRICQPLTVQIPPTLAKILVFGTSVLIGGITIGRIVVTSYANTHCYRAEAYISAEFLDKTTQHWLQEVYFACVVLPFIIPLPIIMVVYILIGIRVRQLSRNSGKNSKRPKDTKFNRFSPSRSSILRSNNDALAQPDNADCERVDGKMSTLLQPALFPQMEWETGGINGNLGHGRIEGFDGIQESRIGMYSHNCISPSSRQHRTHEDERGAGLAVVSGCPEKTRTKYAPFEPSNVEMEVRWREKGRNDEHLLTVRRVKSFCPTTETRLGDGQNSLSLERLQSGRSRLHCTPNNQSEVLLHDLKSMSSYCPERIMINGGASFDDSPDDNREDSNEPAPGHIENQTQDGETNGFNLRGKGTADKRLSWKRMTLIFFLITVVYIFSLLPFFTIYIIFRVAPCYGYELLSQGGYIVLYNFVYITSFSNCFLYGFFDPRFKRQLRIVTASILNMLCRKCRLEEDSV
ncbi:uncharacterized protein [Haliotis cracherodii]|uniref:uncharacterized protein n=1 Tax=Haliotis cracherodii TaxID=6455 RepID=UPI0039E84AFC